MQTRKAPIQTTIQNLNFCSTRQKCFELYFYKSDQLSTWISINARKISLTINRWWKVFNAMEGRMGFSYRFWFSKRFFIYVLVFMKDFYVCFYFYKGFHMFWHLFWKTHGLQLRHSEIVILVHLITWIRRKIIEKTGTFSIIDWPPNFTFLQC